MGFIWGGSPPLCCCLGRDNGPLSDVKSTGVQAGPQLRPCSTHNLLSGNLIPHLATGNPINNINNNKANICGLLLGTKLFTSPSHH